MTTMRIGIFAGQDDLTEVLDMAAGRAGEHFVAQAHVVLQLHALPVGGELRVASAPGHGTKVQVSWPQVAHG